MNFFNDLHFLVRQKLISQNIISNQERILLTPCHYIKLHEKWYSHYIITCQNSSKKFFLKISKNNDSSSHCNNYLKILNNRSRNHLYPLVIVPEFEFNDIHYFITTFIEGISLDCIAQKLTIDEWKLVSQKLVLCLDELSTIHAPIVVQLSRQKSNHFIMN